MKVFFLIYARNSTEILLCELSVHRQEKTVCHAGMANPYGDNYGLRLINTWIVLLMAVLFDSAKRTKNRPLLSFFIGYRRQDRERSE